MTKEELESRVRQLRAELIVHDLVTEAMLTAMDPSARATLDHTFATLSRKWLTTSAWRSPAPSPETMRAVQRSIDHMTRKLRSMPCVG